MTVDGREARISGNLVRIMPVFAPGKQWVIAFANRMCFIMESPIMTMVGVNRGSGVDTGGLDEQVADGDGAGLPVVGQFAAGGEGIEPPVGPLTAAFNGRCPERPAVLSFTAFCSSLWRGFLTAGQLVGNSGGGSEDDGHSGGDSLESSDSKTAKVLLVVIGGG